MALEQIRRQNAPGYRAADATRRRRAPKANPDAKHWPCYPTLTADSPQLDRSLGHALTENDPAEDRERVTRDYNPFEEER
jgi:hypothetical protein